MSRDAPPLRILDTSFNLLGEIDDYESLQFTRRFYRSGEFEIHIHLNKQHTDELKKDHVIMIGNMPHKSGIINHREINADTTETLVVKGTTLGGVFNRRITVTDNYDRVRGSAETVMKHYVQNHIVNGIYPDRAMPFFVCAPDQQRGKQTPWQTRYEPLDQVIQEIAEWCDIGWVVTLDIATKKWVFDVLTGNNLTTSQKEKPPVIFSYEFDNIKSQQFIDSDINYKNVGYAAGKGENEDRLIQSVGSGSGLARREVFLDCSTAEDATELLELGNQKLEEYKQVTTLSGQILDTRSFVYESDWDLGDLVTIQNKSWGLTMDSRITEVTEIYEPDSKIEIGFGNEIPTITKFIRQLQEQTKRRL